MMALMSASSTAASFLQALTAANSANGCSWGAAADASSSAADPLDALQWQKNVSRACDNIVTPECLLAKGAETCVNDIIDQVQAGARQGGAATVRPAVIAVAVVVPVVVVGECVS
jgi:hypothetical protein